jgi:hypothetical protein
MIRKKVPRQLWDYGLIYEAGMLNRIPCGNNTRTGLEMVTAETPDISEWIDFEFTTVFGSTTTRKLTWSAAVSD